MVDPNYLENLAVLIANESLRIATKSETQEFVVLIGGDGRRYSNVHGWSDFFGSELLPLLAPQLCPSHITPHPEAIDKVSSILTVSSREIETFDDMAETKNHPGRSRIWAAHSGRSQFAEARGHDRLQLAHH